MVSKDKASAAKMESKRASTRASTKTSKSSEGLESEARPSPQEDHKSGISEHPLEGQDRATGQGPTSDHGKGGKAEHQDGEDDHQDGDDRHKHGEDEDIGSNQLDEDQSQEQPRSPASQSKRKGSKGSKPEDSDPSDSSDDDHSSDDDSTPGDSNSVKSKLPPKHPKIGSSGGGGGGNRKPRTRTNSKKKKTFRKTPYDREQTQPLDYDDKKDKAVYDKATPSLYASPEDRFSLIPSKASSFLDKITDRCNQCGINVIEVEVHRGRGRKRTPKELNICVSHASITMEDIQDFVDTFVGTESRDTQEDIMLYHMIKNSITEDAYTILALERNTYTLDDTMGGEHPSGLIFLKLCLDNSAVTTSFDPETIRGQLSKAPEKFASLQYNVKELNSWIRENMLHLKSHGQTSTDVLSHLWATYKSSNDQEFVAYITGIEDQVRDDDLDINYGGLMKKAQSKTERLMVSRNLNNISKTGDDGIQALQTEVVQDLQRENQALQAELQAMQTEVPNWRSGSNGSNDRTNKHYSKPRRKYLPPAELQNEPKPSDPNKKITVKNFHYQWCDTHKWCSHVTKDCKRPSSGSPSDGNSGGDNAAQGSRNGRAVKAYNALISR